MAIATDPRNKRTLTAGNLFTVGVHFVIKRAYFAEFSDENASKVVEYPAFECAFPNPDDASNPTLVPKSILKLIRPASIKPIKVGDELMCSAQSSGTLLRELRALLAANRGKTNGEVLPIISDRFANTECVVAAIDFYTVETKNGDIPMPFLTIDIVEKPAEEPAPAKPSRSNNKSKN